MRIETKKTTVADLLALIQDADLAEEVTFGKPAKGLVPCWCGCGGTTKSRFVPGHDAKLHSLAKQVARGTANEETCLAALPHEEAKAHFLEHVEAERAVQAAKTAPVVV